MLEADISDSGRADVLVSDPMLLVTFDLADMGSESAVRIISSEQATLCPLQTLRLPESSHSMFLAQASQYVSDGGDGAIYLGIMSGGYFPVKPFLPTQFFPAGIAELMINNLEKINHLDFLTADFHHEGSCIFPEAP